MVKMIKYTGTKELLKEKGFKRNSDGHYDYYFDNGLGGSIIMYIFDKDGEIMMKNTGVWTDLVWRLDRVLRFAQELGIEDFIVEVEK